MTEFCLHDYEKNEQEGRNCKKVERNATIESIVLFIIAFLLCTILFWAFTGEFFLFAVFDMIF